MLSKIKYYILRVPHFIAIALMLHSKAPNKEIKKLWEVMVIGGLPVTFLTLFCGEKILWFLRLPKIDFINNNGGFIFFIFVIVYIIVFFDYKKCGEITTKEQQNYSKS
jgi:amino acid transporter